MCTPIVYPSWGASHKHPPRITFAIQSVHYTPVEQASIEASSKCNSTGLLHTVFKVPLLAVCLWCLRSLSMLLLLVMRIFSVVVLVYIYIALYNLWITDQMLIANNENTLKLHNDIRNTTSKETCKNRMQQSFQTFQSAFHRSTENSKKGNTFFY